MAATVELPEIELKRLKLLHQYRILDTLPEKHFDDLTRLATYICQTPISAISLTDDKRQWYKSRIGFTSTEEPREITFCAHTIQQTGLFIIPDTLADTRFAHNPFVVGEANIRFYAGAPLRTPSGVALGTLCVLDHIPRNLNHEQLDSLNVLAQQVVTQLELRRNVEHLKYNIVKRQKSEAQLRHNVFHDSLTGLPNRTLFIKRLRAAIAKTQRCKSYLFAVLFVDLDRFKVVNDSLGHMLGDQMLIGTASRLKTCMRHEDVVARLGGDEFVILLNDIQSINDATDIADRIQEALALPFNFCGQEVFTSLSVGIALSTTGHQRPEDFLRDADTAMYQAKAFGKARYKIFNTAMHDSAVKLMQLENDLRRAIERQEFQIYFQPIIRLENSKISGFESLIRWQHPIQGLLDPVNFIAVAEETGAIIPMGYWILTEACRQLYEWQVKYSDPFLNISVNLSPKQLSQPNLIEQISQILQTTGLNPHSLKLEITETAIMENPESAALILSQLRELGIQICMDDFGTGYSSLSFLHRFPVDFLKIDQSFIVGIEQGAEKAKIVQTIMTLTQNLGLNAIAEGIETAEQVAKLKILQCEYGQGYFFSRPLDSKMAEKMIVQNFNYNDSSSLIF
jgi:diguanylate cyclase (GGDEF)-like protein